MFGPGPQDDGCDGQRYGRDADTDPNLRRIAHHHTSPDREEIGIGVSLKLRSVGVEKPGTAHRKYLVAVMLKRTQVDELWRVGGMVIVVAFPDGSDIQAGESVA